MGAAGIRQSPKRKESMVTLQGLLCRNTGRFTVKGKSTDGRIYWTSDCEELTNDLRAMGYTFCISGTEILLTPLKTYLIRISEEDTEPNNLPIKIENLHGFRMYETATDYYSVTFIEPKDKEIKDIYYEGCISNIPNTIWTPDIEKTYYISIVEQ